MIGIISLLVMWQIAAQMGWLHLRVVTPNATIDAYFNSFMLAYFTLVAVLFRKSVSDQLLELNHNEEQLHTVLQQREGRVAKLRQQLLKISDVHEKQLHE
ncbi:hypothetical protein RZS08_59590, partial [Arthrospira platensis SPKY1]|nr:hypothetical protein [Arthrospira platensis SPKY1]